MKKIIKFIAGSMLAIAGNANAALATLDFVADVSSAQNYGGLTAFVDTITATATFDNAGFTGVGSETIYFTGSNTLDITAGSLFFDETNISTGSTASITFNDGQLVDFKYSALFNVNGAAEDFNSSLTSITADRAVNGPTSKDVSLFATWQSAELPITPVPVPAAVWLFGSGLIALVGFARRKSA